MKYHNKPKTEIKVNQCLSIESSESKVENLLNEVKFLFKKIKFKYYNGKK